MKAEKVSKVMTKKPTYCSPRTSLHDVARMMRDADCGAIPVVGEDTFPIGMITDRDIVLRSVALGKDPASMIAGDCMSAPAITITEDADLDDCIEALELAQIRRVIIVDRKGRTTGIIAQADIASYASKKETGALLRAVSKPEPKPRAAPEASADGAKPTLKG
ncbi:CBS domain-containing protein [soil metagenome]